MLFDWLGSTISAEELFGPVLEAQEGMRVGWPDDAVALKVSKPPKLQQMLRTSLSSFRTFWAGASIVVDIDVSMAHRRLDVRVARVGSQAVTGPTEYEARTAPARRALDQWIPALEREVRKSGGTAHRGYDGCHFGLSLPVRSVGGAIGRRQHAPELDEADWEARYRSKLARTSWSSLRDEAYRFCHLATKVAEQAVSAKASRVLRERAQGPETAVDRHAHVPRVSILRLRPYPAFDSATLKA